MKALDPLKVILTQIQVLGIILLIGLVSCNKKKSFEEGAAIKAFIADSIYIKQGNQLVAFTFDTLRNSLLSAIHSQGFDGAIAFCNEKAYLITATYADSVIIRRTSLRTRNPENNPDSLETIVLNDMEQLASVSQTPGVKIVRQPSNGEIHFFKPIMLQSMCLNCHGTADVQIQRTTLTKIQELYPNDRAVNFKEGDLRGLWHIIFKPKR